MSMKPVNNSGIAALLLLAATAIHAQPAKQVKDDPAASAERYALHQLVTLLQQTTSLQSDVKQLVMDQEGREVQETKAKLQMQKPDNFRWEIVAPYSELMVTDGKTIWRYEPDLDQVTIAAFKGKIDRTPVMLLNGSEQSIGQSYEVTASSMTDSGPRQRFILQPRHADSLFERMSLTFNGSTLEEMQFEDSLGQKTSLTFSAVQRNQALDAGIFHYTPPKGAEVIDDTRN
jgi:outer membrane lipoprotein carrier protein